MKLNLLPTSVSQQGWTTGAIVTSVLLVVVSALASAGLILGSRANLETARNDALQYQQGAADALATSQQADAQIQQVAVIDRHLKLAEAMRKHNSAYTTLYDDLFPYIPAYFRLETITADPVSPTQASVTMTGYLQSFSQYADMSIALWKIPGVVSVSRAGYTLDRANVPPLSELDQDGRPIRDGEEPLPTDPFERMNALIERAGSAPSGFQNTGNFGSSETRVRGAMPGFSAVTYSIVIDRELQTPDPRATITSGGGAGAAPGGAAPAAPGGVRPGGPPPGTTVPGATGIDAAGANARPEDDR